MRIDSNQLNLICLDIRRDESDLIVTFKIIVGYCDVNAELYFEFDMEDRRGVEDIPRSYSKEEIDMKI